MSWRISIVHTTTHRYAEDVYSSYNEARITPLTLPRQTCVDTRIDVQPVARLSQYWDYWGTLVNSFDTHTPHSSLVVRGRSIVDTFPQPLPAGGFGWDALAGDDVVDRLAELLMPTSYVPALAEAAADVRASAPGGPADAARAAADWVRDRLRYEPGATDVTTSAAESLARGRGVCQDFAHLTLGVVRSLGIPARYVSGYLHPAADAGLGDTIEGQSHAWVEWWCGDWVGWDPTHGIPVGERHVVVGRGRDYGDVPPLKGVYQGAPAVEHEVGVAITRMA